MYCRWFSRSERDALKRRPYKTFTLTEVYAHADSLASLHPANRHIQPKIRHQLQVLRDWGLLEFLGGGSYRLR